MQPNSLQPQTMEPKSPFAVTPSKTTKLPPLQSTPSIPLESQTVDEDSGSNAAIIIGESFSLQERFARFRKDKQRVIRNQAVQSQQAQEVLFHYEFKFLHAKYSCFTLSPPSPLLYPQARCDPVVMQQLRDKFLERCNAYKVICTRNISHIDRLSRVNLTRRHVQGVPYAKKYHEPGTALYDKCSSRTDIM